MAVFNGLVRVADGTGIQLDAGLDAASRETRSALGIDAYGGAANTPVDGGSGGSPDQPPPPEQPLPTVAQLFG